MDVIPGSVLIGTPHSGSVTGDYAQAVGRLLLENPYDSIVGHAMMSSSRNEIARNQIIQTFLDGPGERLMWIDSDMWFTPQDYVEVYDGISDDYPISAGLCFMYSPGEGVQAPNCFEIVDRRLVPMWHYPRNDWFECAATGSAFVMIHRKVFEEMPQPWHWNYRAGEIDDVDDKVSHDLAFCLKSGYRVRYTSRADVGHVKSWTANEQSYDAFMQRGNLPA